MLTVHLNVSSGALQELFSLIASGGRQTNAPHEVVACDDAKEVFCSNLPHWAPVLLSRCDAFANVAEAMHELDILSEELRLKEKYLGDLEHDRHSLRSEIHINKTSSTLQASRLVVAPVVTRPIHPKFPTRGYISPHHNQR